MTERNRSKDSRRETEEVLGVTPENLNKAPSGAGRSGGEIARKTGTRDEEKRYDETSAGATRPLAQDQDKSGDKEGV
ncbi:hypothetical protein ACN2XU_20445 [Primorskyibacter sp. 2E107]|uniref:hypothetical protein n=1 Tax=Primorskyibacter sp. 2E107 TaxID=3403458 RepID=UPI003AF5044E